MARAQDEWVVKKIPGSGVACGVVRYGATAERVAYKGLNSNPHTPKSIPARMLSLYAKCSTNADRVPGKKITRETLELINWINTCTCLTSPILCILLLHIITLEII
ncbi:hypothetical protein MTP99_014037 [Tenebrio molitor]|nr:hypothetical protein MTP99_014037 [Tenebrio molitor]